MAAPELSRTEPTIDPPLICAHEVLTSSSDKAAAQPASFDMHFIRITCFVMFPGSMFRPGLSPLRFAGEGFRHRMTGDPNAEK